MSPLVAVSKNKIEETPYLTKSDTLRNALTKRCCKQKDLRLEFCATKVIMPHRN